MTRAGPAVPAAPSLRCQACRQAREELIKMTRLPEIRDVALVAEADAVVSPAHAAAIGMPDPGQAWTRVHQP